MAGKIHDRTASSFLAAMVNLGDKPSLDFINTVLGSFCDLDEDQQDRVTESPKYWNTMAKWGTEEDREKMARANVERLKEDLESTIKGVSTRRSAAVKTEAARLLARIPEEGKLFEWTRAMVCKEDFVDDSAAGKAGFKGVQ